MAITGTISILQPIAPFVATDVNPTHFARYGVGGVHSVGTTADRDAIAFTRRELGMLAYVSSLDKYYSLVGSTSNTGWVEFTVDAVGDGNPAGPNGAVQFRDGTGFSGVSSLTYDSAAGLLVLGSDAAIEFGDGSVQQTARNFYGLTGATSPDYPSGVSGTGYTGDRLLLATGPSADPFRNYVRFGNAWFQTGVVGIGQGPQGIQGTAGERGATGATGLSGEKGERGETGSPGEPGERGATGPTGERGATGFGGATGPEGALQFNDGGQLSGDAGLIFDSGTRNVVLGSDVAIEFGDGSVQRTARNFYGLTGATSSEYPQGVSSTGYTGDRLLIATGPSADPFRNYIRFGNAWVQTGVVGIGQGPQGIQGTAGDKGETGPTGLPGERGATGETGPTGSPGERGATGPTGSFTGDFVSSINSFTGDVFIVPGSNITIDLLPDGVLGGDGIVISATGFGQFFGITGPTTPSFPSGMSGSGGTGDRLLIATGPSADPFRNYVKFGSGWFQTGVVGIGQGPQGIQGTAGNAGATGATGAGAGMRYDWFSYGDYQDTLTECYPADSCCAFTNGRVAIIDNDNGSTAQMAGGFPTFPFLAIAGNDILNNNEQGYIESWHQIPELTDSDLVGGVIHIRADDQSEYPRHIAWEIKGRWAIAQGSLLCPGKKVYYFGGRLLSGFTGDTSFANSTQLRVNFSRAGVRGHTGTGERGATGATGERGATGATGPQFFLIDEFSTTVPSVVVKGTSSYDLSGESVSLTYADFAMPVTGGIYLTNPSNGTGFPVYFPTAAMDTVTFSGQTLTAGIGETVTLRIVVTGQNGSYDVQDHAVTIGNEIRWGTSSLQSLTSGDIITLPNTVAKNDLNNLFTVGMSAGDYIYVSYPSRLGQSLQSINNAAYGGMALQGRFGIPGEPSLTYTNINGYAETFYVYRSENSLPSPSLLVRTIPVP